MTPAISSGRMRSYQNADKGIGCEGEQISVINFGDTGGKRLGCDARHTISVRDVEYLLLWDLGAKWGQRLNLLILVVDDEPDVEVLFRQLFRRDLSASRFTMEFAQSAPAALQRIADAAGASLFLILSDINMPGMSGLEFLPKAKALRPDVPVIMITAYGDAETKRKALEGGAEALLTKPIDFVTLRNEIDLLVERVA